MAEQLAYQLTLNDLLASQLTETTTAAQGLETTLYAVKQAAEDVNGVSINQFAAEVKSADAEVIDLQSQLLLMNRRMNDPVTGPENLYTTKGSVASDRSGPDVAMTGGYTALDSKLNEVAASAFIAGEVTHEYSHLGQVKTEANNTLNILLLPLQQIEDFAGNVRSAFDVLVGALKPLIDGIAQEVEGLIPKEWRDGLKEARGITDTTGFNTLASGADTGSINGTGSGNTTNAKDGWSDKRSRDYAPSNATGTRSVNINIQVGKLIEKLSINSTTVTEGVDKMQNLVANALMRALNDSQIVADM